MVWLAANRPPESNLATLIHNDFKFDNLVLDPADLTHVVAVLDWEMATLGDPLMDLGTTLAYWTEPDDPRLCTNSSSVPQPSRGPPPARPWSNATPPSTGRDASNMLFCYVCGLFKVAVIAQQIYARYARGLTQDATLRIIQQGRGRPRPGRCPGNRCPARLKKGDIAHFLELWVGQRTDEDKRWHERST